MELRIAQITDADAIIAFDHIAASEPARVQFIHDQIESSACYVALIDAKVVAYAVLNYKFYDNGWIEMLYVHPQFRRQGIGSALIRHLNNACRTPKLFTSTNQSNFPMQQLLATLEFDRSGIIENLDEGDPELVYFKRLRDNAT
ncbi:MAG: GNAT family N-acetyltransferase [Spirulinaceae cyanobacterium RM2_2_10]|nr:GNAT family N-acetyltransferase [bacterium]NJO18846.1 GNAT family N-acetyltransferase [Spirulinaceae cyanobacterium RM2_2_10]